MAARTIVFFPEGAFGPTNNCVGIGDVLRRRGHRIVFIVEESFAGTLEAKGFEERTMRLAPPPETPEEPGQFWKDFIRDTAPVFRKSTFDQLGEFILPTWQALVDGARYVDERLVEILDEVAPDVVVEDNVVRLPRDPGERPALGADRLLQPARGEGSRRCRRPSPACRSTTGASGTRSGRSTRGRSATCSASFSEFCVERGAPPLPEPRADPRVALAQPLRSTRPSSTIRAAARSAQTWQNLETSVRATDAPWSPPEPDGRRARLPQPRLARVGRCPPDEAARRRARGHAAPLRREQGAAARRVRARGQHGRRGVPAADLRPPARRRW